MCVCSVKDDPILVDSNVAIGTPASAPGLKFSPVLPQQITCCGIKRLHDIAWTRQEHHAVMDNRSRLLGPGLHPPGPHHTQIANIFPCNLLKRTVAPTVLGSAPIEPAFSRWVGQ